MVSGLWLGLGYLGTGWKPGGDLVGLPGYIARAVNSLLVLDIIPAGPTGEYGEEALLGDEAGVCALLGVEAVDSALLGLDGELASLGAPDEVQIPPSPDKMLLVLLPATQCVSKC